MTLFLSLHWSATSNRFPRYSKLLAEKKADDLLQKHYRDYSRTQVSVQPRRPQLKVAYTRLPNTERRVPELIPVLGSQPAGDVSHKPGGRLLLLSARPTVALATLKRAATNFAAW